jgi:hypothetical protein
VLLAGALALGAAGCAGDNDDPTLQAPPTSVPATSRPPATKPPATRPPGTTAAAVGGLTAETVVVRLKRGGLPILGWTLVTAETDPDHKVGRPGGAKSKVTFSDRRLAAGGGTEASSVATGGAIEVYANRTEAAGRAASAGTGRALQRGTVVIVLSSRLDPKAVGGYRDALDKLPA